MASILLQVRRNDYYYYSSFLICEQCYYQNHSKRNWTIHSLVQIVANCFKYSIDNGIRKFIWFKAHNCVLIITSQVATRNQLSDIYCQVVIVVLSLHFYYHCFVPNNNFSYMHTVAVVSSIQQQNFDVHRNFC